MWYWFAGAIAVIGVVASIGWGATRAWNAYRAVDSFARHEVPGSMAVPVEEPGPRIIYYEGHDQPTLGEIGVAVRDPAGNDVMVERYRLDLRYDYQGRVGRAIADFDAGIAGRYIVEAATAPETGAIVAVGEDITSVVPVVLWTIGLALLSLVAGAAVVGITNSRRSRISMERSER